MLSKRYSVETEEGFRLLYNKDEQVGVIQFKVVRFRLSFTGGEQVGFIQFKLKSTFGYYLQMMNRRGVILFNTEALSSMHY